MLHSDNPGAAVTAPVIDTDDTLQLQFVNRYADDTIDSVYADIARIESALNAVARGIKEKAKAFAEADADYNEAKEKTLLELFNEELGDAEKGIAPFSRTVAQREALYRQRHKDLRRKRGVAEHDMKSEGDLLKALSSQLTAAQTRANLLKLELDLAGRAT